MLFLNCLAMASNIQLKSIITVDSAVEYDSSGKGIVFFDFDSWARNNAVPGCDCASKIDLITTTLQQDIPTWFIEIKDFRYIHYKPNEKNITGIGFTLEKKIMGTCKILSSPDCIPEVKALQPDSGVTNFLFHYEMPLATNKSAYFPSGYPITAIQYLKTNSIICSMFKNVYAANAKMMNASDIYPWTIKLTDNRK